MYRRRWFVREENGVYLVTAPAMPECSAAGPTREAAIKGMFEALAARYAMLEQLGQPVPEDAPAGLEEMLQAVTLCTEAAFVGRRRKPAKPKPEKQPAPAARPRGRPRSAPRAESIAAPSPAPAPAPVRAAPNTPERSERTARTEQRTAAPRLEDMPPTW